MQWSVESTDLLREIGDTQHLSRALDQRGLNFLAIDDPVGAGNSFKAALRIAYDSGFMPSALNALAGLAALESKNKASQGTLELVIFMLQHPSSNQETKNLATRLRMELESILPQEEIEAAQQRAGSKGLDELVHQFLAGV